jgi:hypothetical protein
MKPLSARFVPVALALVAVAAVPPSAPADQPLGTLHVRSFSLDPDEDGFAVLRLAGTAEGLGNCACYGEIEFGEVGGTFEGTGVVAFTAADGDLLVGVIAADIDEDGVISAEVHWRDAVTFSDGTTVASTGRFLEHRPAGVFFHH